MLLLIVPIASGAQTDVQQTDVSHPAWERSERLPVEEDAWSDVAPGFAVHDLDADGRADFVQFERSGAFTAWFSSSGSAVDFDLQELAGADFNRIDERRMPYITDMDGDGDLEVVVVAMFKGERGPSRNMYERTDLVRDLVAIEIDSGGNTELEVTRLGLNVTYDEYHCLSYCEHSGDLEIDFSAPFGEFHVIDIDSDDDMDVVYWSEFAQILFINDGEGALSRSEWTPSIAVRSDAVGFLPDVSDSGFADILTVESESRGGRLVCTIRIQQFLSHDAPQEVAEIQAYSSHENCLLASAQNARERQAFMVAAPGDGETLVQWWSRQDGSDFEGGQKDNVSGELQLHLASTRGVGTFPGVAFQVLMPERSGDRSPLRSVLWYEEQDGKTGASFVRDRYWDHGKYIFGSRVQADYQVRLFDHDSDGDPDMTFSEREWEGWTAPRWMIHDAPPSVEDVLVVAPPGQEVSLNLSRWVEDPDGSSGNLQLIRVSNGSPGTTVDGMDVTIGRSEALNGTFHLQFIAMETDGPTSRSFNITVELDELADHVIVNGERQEPQGIQNLPLPAVSLLGLALLTIAAACRK